MGASETRAIIEYLRGLAPRFFGERMRGASEAEVARLEAAAGNPLTDSHREFLSWAGASPATALNPFLNDRDFCVEKLLAEYAGFSGPMPARTVLFSASDILGETLVLRSRERLDEEPEIGELRFDAEHLALVDGKFLPRDTGPFENWLRWLAFIFRLSQPEHQVVFEPPWNPEKKQWEGNAPALAAAYQVLGFRPVFQLSTGMICLDRGDIVATLYGEGSGELAGDDEGELEHIASLLGAQASLHFAPRSPALRMFAPRH